MDAVGAVVPAATQSNLPLRVLTRTDDEVDVKGLLPTSLLKYK